MNKINLSLRLRLTILTVILLFFMSGILTIFINDNASSKISSSVEPIRLTIAKAVSSEELTDKESIEFNSEVIEATPLRAAEIKYDENEKLQVPFKTVEMQLINVTNDIKRNSYLAFAIVIFFGGICSYFVSGRILKPVRSLADEMENITAKNLSNPINTENSASEIKKLSDSFNIMLSNLNNAFEVQKRFNTNAAHELRTPIAILQANIEALEDGNAELDDYKYFCGIAGRTVERMDLLVQNLLNMTQSENVDMDEIININTLINQACNDAQFLSEKSDVKIISNMCKFNIEVKGNKTLFHTVVYNIIENGIRYNNRGGSISVYTSINNGNAEITISDTGIGINDTDLKNIFQPFYRVDKSRSRAFGGAGMGLCLVKNIVENHGGTIKAVSEPQKGSCFIIDIPLISKTS